MALLIRYWKPLAVFLLLLMTWLHGHHYGVESTTQRYEYARLQDAKYAAEELAKAQAKARKQEADWAAAFDLSANMYQESYNDLQKRRDRIMRDVASGRVRLPPIAPAHLPEAPADSGQPPQSTDSGQPGLAGEELISRFAQCDEVTIERNQAVRLLEAERGQAANP